MVYLKEHDLPEFLAKLDAYDGSFQTKLALKFLLLTFVRTTELRGAEWKEVDFGKAEWRIPPGRMKMRDTHSGGRLPGEIQPGEAAQSAGLRESGGFCGAELSIPNSGRASPSLRWGWTKNKQKHKLNPVPGLTHELDQKSEPGQKAHCAQ